MTDTEKQIESIGYKVRVIDMLCNYIVYENDACVCENYCSFVLVVLSANETLFLVIARGHICG